jgi:F0F1-type ATP synthase assembly protein I
MPGKTCELCGSTLTFRNSFYYDKKNVCKACLRKCESGQPIAAGSPKKPIQPVKGFSTAVCWFCQKNSPSQKAGIIVKMHKTLEVGQSIGYPVLGVRQARYYSETIIVPRCDSCKNKHQEQASDMVSTGVLTFFVGLITIGTGIISGILINKIIPGTSSLPGIFLGILLGFGAGCLSALVLGKLVPKEDTSIKKKDAYIHYPLIEQKESASWKLGEKPLL